MSFRILRSKWHFGLPVEVHLPFQGGQAFHHILSLRSRHTLCGVKATEDRNLVAGEDSQNVALRSLLRSILREAGRLPDPASRQYISSYVLRRFRTRHNNSTTKLRQQQRTRATRRGLATLEKANTGYMAQNLKVLMMTYGRAGRRRRELLDKFLEETDDTPTHGLSTNIISDGLPGLHPDNVRKIPSPTAIHVALLRSQRSIMNPIASTKQFIRRITPRVDVLNSWKRPMPQKRLVNMAEAHWRVLMERTMPPLGAEEWERLRLLATGREYPPHLADDAAQSGHLEHARLEDGENHLHDVLSDPRDLQKKFAKEKEVKGGARVKPHVISRRYMQRLWAQVFELTPKMHWDIEGNRWKIRWGVEALRERRRGKNTSGLNAFKSIDDV